MQRHRIRHTSVAVLFAVVVGLAAATLDDTRGGSDGGRVYDVSYGRYMGWDLAGQFPEIPFAGVFVAVLIAVLLAGIFTWRREFSAGTVVTGAVLGFGGLALWILAQSGETQEKRTFSEGQEWLRSATVEATTLGAHEGPQTTTPVMFVFVALAALIGFLAVLMVMDRSDDSWLPDGGEGAEDEDEEALAAVGRTAGEAADRLEGAGADVDNEVYRAWDEMTRELEVDNRGARTPGEFRAAALSAGMAREDVDVLTNLFEEVRYGGAEPTEDRERAAVDALRRIERQYADAAEAA